MENQPLNIMEFRAQNVKKLKAVQIRPDQSSPVVLLTGKNRQGKTSVLDSIWMALGGASMIPSKPIRDGEESGECTLDLGEFLVTRRFTPKGEYLNVTTKDGFKAPKPQEFLNSKFAGRAWNPMAFIGLSKGDQIKVLQDIVNLKLDYDELSEITGLPTRGTGGDILKALAGMSPVEVIDQMHKHLFEARTKVNQSVKELEGTISSLSKELPPGGSIERASIKELFNERTTLEGIRAQNDAMRRKYQAVLDEMDRLRTGDLVKAVSEIEELERKLEAARKKKDEIEKSIVEKAANSEDLRMAVERLVDPDFSEINTRISGADAQNRLADLSDQVEAAKIRLGESLKEAGKYTVKLNDLKSYKVGLIESAGLPHPGLGFENGEVTYNGLPLSQASGREQIEVSCAICAAQHPSIGILTIDVGWSELDSEGKAVLEDFAVKNGLQIWCTQVLEEPGAKGFHLYGGEVVAVDGQKPEETHHNIEEEIA